MCLTEFMLQLRERCEDKRTDFEKKKDEWMTKVYKSELLKQANRNNTIEQWQGLPVPKSRQKWSIGSLIWIKCLVYGFWAYREGWIAVVWPTSQKSYSEALYDVTWLSMYVYILYVYNSIHTHIDIKYVINIYLALHIYIYYIHINKDK